MPPALFIGSSSGSKLLTLQQPKLTTFWFLCVLLLSVVAEMVASNHLIISLTLATVAGVGLGAGSRSLVNTWIAGKS